MKKKRVNLSVYLFAILLGLSIAIGTVISIETYKKVSFNLDRNLQYSISNNSYYPTFFNNTERIYDKLNSNEAFHADAIINEIRPLFLGFVYSINVTNKDIYHICKDFSCGGVFLSRNSEIVIRYTKSDFRVTLCHEILHAVIYADGEGWGHPIHKIVFDLAEEGVCYK